MFRQKLPKQSSPPGTFIPTPARVAAIMHLCFAFSLLLWILSQPFMGDLFTLRSRLLLHETLKGEKELANPGQRERNRHRFASLPEKQQRSIQDAYQKVQKELQISFGTKILRSLKLLALRTPSWELAWLFFSLIIPILLLKRVDGSPAASWLLVAITLLYAIDNQSHAYPQKSALAELVPTEKELSSNYLEAPLDSDPTIQYQQLQQAWRHYLVNHWAKQSLTTDPVQFTLQLEEGEFAFNLALLEHQPKLSQTLALEAPPQRQPSIINALYLLWNVLFALLATCYCRKEPNLKSYLAEIC